MSEDKDVTNACIVLTALLGGGLIYLAGLMGLPL